MGLFRNKKEDKKTCCCGGNFNADTMKTAEENKAGGSRVKILGSGCAKCNQLEKNTLEALKQLQMNTDIEHVTDFTQIAAYGVMTTPALVVGGKVIAFGKVLTTDEIMKLLEKSGVHDAL